MSRFKNALSKSIKWRFTGIFIALIAGILMVIIAVNSFFLESVYTKDKVKVLENAYNVLDSMIEYSYQNNADVSALFPEDYDPTNSDTETPATRYIRELSETYNINVVVLDTSTDRTFATMGDWKFQMMKLEQYILGNTAPFKVETLKQFDNYTIERNQNRRSTDMYLESWGYFSDNKTCFLMSMPVASLREAVGFFNQFLLIIGIAALVIGAVIVYFTSKQIAKPINALAKLSEKMSALDFTARYEGNSRDEIGTLGNSMNKLSDTLEQTIAELKTANNELQSDIEDKMQIDKRRQEFVANVSHELKTPIALIQGYAEGLQDGMAEEPESRDYYCSVIVDEAGKMNKMVRQLMNLSSLEQGMDKPVIEMFDLGMLVRGVISAADILIRQKQAQVEVDVPENCMVWADEFKIEEVITNYLNNALNHLEAPNVVRIYTAEKDGRIYLHVRNTGKQIPEEDLDQIWDKFFKVDKAHTRAYGGSGLGLSIVKAIADTHHQSCGVSNVEDGVDFWFSLDAKK